MRAFTLIELMVILAIIGILTAAAVPTYKSYLRNARLANARQYVDSMNNTIANYYKDYGIIPTNAQINLPTAVPSSVAQYLHQPYVAYVLIGPETTTASQCQYGISTAYLSNYQGDYYEDGTSPYVVLYNYFIDHNGVMSKQCAYYEFDPTTSQPTRNDIFPDCIRTDDPNTSAIMTFINSACN